MPRNGHSDEQIMYALLRQVETGKKASEVCREMGVSSQAFYSWKRRFAGMVRNPGEGERDSGMKVNTDSGIKPNTFWWLRNGVHHHPGLIQRAINAGQHNR